MKTIETVKEITDALHQGLRHYGSDIGYRKVERMVRRRFNSNTPLPKVTATEIMDYCKTYRDPTGEAVVRKLTEKH